MKKKVRRRPSIDIIQSYTVIVKIIVIYKIAALLWFRRKEWSSDFTSNADCVASQVELFHVPQPQ